MRDIISHNLGYFETTTTTPVAGGLYTVLPSSVLLCDARAIATRISDGACKAWGAEALVRNFGIGLEVLVAIPSVMNVWVSAADAITLAAVTVSIYTDATQFGFLATGLAAPMAWAFRMTVRGMTDSPPE